MMDVDEFLTEQQAAERAAFEHAAALCHEYRKENETLIKVNRALFWLSLALSVALLAVLLLTEI